MKGGGVSWAGNLGLLASKRAGKREWQERCDARPDHACAVALGEVPVSDIFAHLEQPAVKGCMLGV